MENVGLDTVVVKLVSISIFLYFNNVRLTADLHRVIVDEIK
jgi:hypothetical protein